MSGLLAPRPSQKFTARGLLSVAIPNNANFISMLSPNIASDSGYPSLNITWNTTGALGDATSVFTSPTVAAEPLGLNQAFAATNTPYQYSTLDDGTDNWRLVSCGVRMRYVGPKLYQGGLIKFYHDTRGDLLLVGELTTLTFDGLIQRLNSHQGVIRSSLTEHPTLSCVFPSVTNESQEWAEIPYVAPACQEWDVRRFGGTTSGKMMGQPIAYMYGVNNTGQTLYLDIEVVEHWEICGRTVDALNTPSTGHSEVANGMSTLVVSAAQHLVTNPHKSYTDALKSVAKDPHVKAAFTGFASNCMSTALALL